MSNCKLKPDVVEFYVAAPLAHINAVPVRERMETIRLLTRQMFNEAAKQKRMEPAIPLPGDFPEEYEALTKLAKSFSHSSKFSRTIISATDRTVNHIVRDKTTIVPLRLWRKMPANVKEEALKKIVGHFINASATLFNLPFRQPSVIFFREAGDACGDVTQGYYTDCSPPNSTGEVAINKHKDAFYLDSLQAAATALHEAVHAVQDQIGVIGRVNPSLVKPYKHDSQLAIAISEHKALIDYRLDTPYRAQFHERLAFSADERFYNNLKAAL